MKYFCPIVLKNQKLKEFLLASNVKIRPMDISENEEFFGLEKFDFTFSSDFRSPGIIKWSKAERSKTKPGRFPYTELIKKGIHDGTSDILASKYIVEVETDDYSRLFDLINLCFKLLRPTSTGIAISFREQETDVHIHNKMQVLNGPFDYLLLTELDILELQKIYELLNKDHDDKFRIYAELYTRSILGDSNLPDIRFIFLITALEAMYVPDRGSEINFRLRLRVSNFLSPILQKPSIEIFELVRKIYDIRGGILHAGKSSELTDEIFFKLIEMVQYSLNYYLKDKSKFDVKYLNQICLH